MLLTLIMLLSVVNAQWPPRPYAALVRILPGMARTARAAPDAVGLNSTPRDCVREPQ